MGFVALWWVFGYLWPYWKLGDVYGLASLPPLPPSGTRNFFEDPIFHGCWARIQTQDLTDLSQLISMPHPPYVLTSLGMGLQWSKSIRRKETYEALTFYPWGVWGKDWWLWVLQQFCGPIREKVGDAGVRAIGWRTRCIRRRVWGWRQFNKMQKRKENGRSLVKPLVISGSVYPLRHSYSLSS